MASIADDLLRQIEVDATVLRLIVEDYVVHDDMTVPSYTGPHVCATVFAGRASVLTAAGREVRMIERDAVRGLHGLAAAARVEPITEGMDTATARPLTVLALALEHARGGAHSFVAPARINHLVPRALPPAWSELLRRLRDSFGASRGTLADAWDHAMTWCCPVALGDVWDAGGVVRLPHVVTAIASDTPIYLRTGQPDVTASVLYRLDAHTLTSVDDRAVIPRLDGAVPRWRLPCGGGAITVRHEWQQPTRIVIRCDDARGIYVQLALA